MFEVSAQAEGGASTTPATTLGAPRQSSRKGGKASLALESSYLAPSQELHGAALNASPIHHPPHATEHPQARDGSQPSRPTPADTEMSGQLPNDAQCYLAGQPSSSGHIPFEAHPFIAARSELPGRYHDEDQNPAARQPDTDEGHHAAANQRVVALVGEPDASQGQAARATQVRGALVGEITAVYRRYEDLRRARQRIELQAIATCRTVCCGDKTEGMKLYKKPTVEVAVWLAPYEAAMEPLALAIKEHERLLTKLGKQLPVAAWADTVPGLSHRFLAAIVGECGIGPGEFKSVSALWKRMGMAVINGGRQRRVTGDAAIEHGYVARRRALMWNIGDQVAVRQGIRNPKDEEGNSTGAIAINEWGALYLERKAYELAREVEPGKPMTPMHAHNRAKRYVEKRLLRSLWQEWRRACHASMP